ncbi:hypothetical protein ACE1SV_69320 [Streptomyces sp. E-15]
MARPRGFDTDVAVEQAMDLFWRQGIRATPVPRLTALLGVGSGSLYAAFGSKDGLYAWSTRPSNARPTTAPWNRCAWP